MDQAIEYHYSPAKDSAHDVFVLVIQAYYDYNASWADVPVLLFHRSS